FVIAGVTQWLSPDTLTAALAAAPTKSWPIIHGILTPIVAHATVFARIAATVHVILGVWLLSGFFTRIAASIACALLIIYTAILGGLLYGPNASAAYAALSFTLAVGSVLPMRFYYAAAFGRAVFNKIGSHWATWPGALESFTKMNMPHEASWYRAF